MRFILSVILLHSCTVSTQVLSSRMVTLKGLVHIWSKQLNRQVKDSPEYYNLILYYDNHKGDWLLFTSQLPFHIRSTVIVLRGLHQQIKEEYESI